MKERWMEYTRKADFKAWGEALQVSPLTARILKNRGIDSVEEARAFLYGSLKDLPDPAAFPEFARAAQVLEKAVREGTLIAIASDFDADGIFAGQVLFEGIEAVGGQALIFIPDRMHEGYGINRRIVDEAAERGAGLIVTCDNGIAALDAVSYAKEKGLSIVVTDHHEVQFDETEEGRVYRIPEADAVVDPKSPDSTYPFRFLCGAGVAFRLIQVLYQRFGLPEEKAEELLEYVAIATVADVVELTGENRILVKEGMKRLRRTEKVPLRALLAAFQVEPGQLETYHISFKIAPCFNTTGRIADIREAVEFLKEKDTEKAARKAEEMIALNDVRKKLLDEGVLMAEETVEKEDLLKNRVLIVYVPGVHQSLAGLIAGRLKEKYYRPTFVLTKDETPGLLKGSGRSIEGYHMLEELMGVKPLLVKGGGHAMAAGLTIEEAKLDEFRSAMNARCRLTEEDLTPVVWIDARVPLSFLTPRLVEELSELEPFGTANPSPLFAGTSFLVERLRTFEGKNIVQLQLNDGTARLKGVMFGDPAPVISEIRTHYGEEVLQRLLQGSREPVELAFTFVPKTNEFRGTVSVELRCRNCCRIERKVV